jgi:hypothetical protein
VGEENSQSLTEGRGMVVLGMVVLGMVVLGMVVRRRLMLE